MFYYQRVHTRGNSLIRVRAPRRGITEAVERVSFSLFLLSQPLYFIHISISAVCRSTGRCQIGRGRASVSDAPSPSGPDLQRVAEPNRKGFLFRGGRAGDAPAGTTERPGGETSAGAGSADRLRANPFLFSLRPGHTRRRLRMHGPGDRPGRRSRWRRPLAPSLARDGPPLCWVETASCHILRQSSPSDQAQTTVRRPVDRLAPCPLGLGRNSIDNVVDCAASHPRQGQKLDSDHKLVGLP